MSQLLINQFLNDLDLLRAVSGTNRETVVREAFKDLLKGWAKSYDLVFIPEYDFETPAKERRQVDGALLYSLRVPFGYWEAKDEDDNLDREIEKKKRRGYPQDNILFEDSHTAVLIQNRQEVARATVDDTHALERILHLFFSYERPEIAQFRKAVEQFKVDLPNVLDALREKIEAAHVENAAFRRAEAKFLKHARDTINPNVGPADVREMLIQHILTEEIFSKVFDDGEFHHQNNVAKELYALEEKFFTGATKKQALKQLEPYYAAIRTAATQIPSHAEKQTFLKVIYESFYKVYNPKAADRLGVIYTPGEIVRFMVESADWLCEKHFGKSLIDKGVEILDPAVGTGTFICELLEHFRGRKDKLAFKYKEELHANEVAILPYYVANLNIEATYAAITGQYAEFPNLCFVDTLDNVAGLGKFSGHQEDLFGALSEENVERIKRQNRRKISVIIGNPPYNANQQNESEDNKNREYPRIDKRIKDTYIRESTAQKTKVYDMYARFFRWASDRIADEGIVAFVTNRSFLSARTFDGFRKIVAQDFNEIRIFDLGGDVRSNPKLSGTKHNVFGIQTGVAIAFFVKRREVVTNARILYARRPELETRDDKLAFLGSSRITSIDMMELAPDAKSNWLDLADNDFDTLLPIASKETKNAKTRAQERAIFKVMSFGIATNRDDWLYDFSRAQLAEKVSFFVGAYETARREWHATRRNENSVASYSPEIKWTTELQSHARRNDPLSYDPSNLRAVQYRPFVRTWAYVQDIIVHRLYQQAQFFALGAGQTPNTFIALTDPTAQKPWMVLASDILPDLHLVGAAAGAVCLASDRIVNNARVSNITDWALAQFQSHYGQGTQPITKDAIFHYVYAVLHDPIYRERYALNLKREFPRIPFYKDFWRWANWGEILASLHIGYEGIAPWKLKRTDTRDEKAQNAGLAPKTVLKADKENGIIEIDSETQLARVPKEAWSYQLGNRSALEWILDQYKEGAPRDPTVRAKFNTYGFANYKEEVIDLLTRVTRVSVETMAIVAAMKALNREADS
ncbi:MAG: N-6 DNA methylase [Methylobacteriaceae bacterium]|nr:N-6 DNA methylase [Methylobacteriaceae bacterium]